MALFTIPVTGTVAPFNEVVEFGTVAYTLRFRYNLRDEAWRVTFERDGAVLLRNLKLVYGLDLLAQFRYIENLPQNRVVVMDLDGGFQDPTGVTFGDRAMMFYEEDD